MKTKYKMLAILGGQPAFNSTLHVGSPNIGSRASLFGRINDALDRRWLTNAGPLVEEFEARVSELTGVKNCITICNATTALEIAIRAVGLKGEVIVPSYTFIATPHALQWQEITPVFADIDPQTHTLDPNCIERLITPETTGILAVHLWGQACDIDAIQGIAAKHSLQVIYDASHAFACSYKGQMIGGFGDCEVFSFHATKFLNSFEGGAVVTNDDALAEKIRLMRNFGFAGYDDVIYLGVNGKMTEVCAAMGLTSLESMEEILATNRANYLSYQHGLAKLPGLTTLEYKQNEQTNYQYIVVNVDQTESHLSRDEIVAVLQAENVLARKYFWPGCHRMEPYKSLQPNAHLHLPQTERVASSTFLLPTGQAITADKIQIICAIIESALAQSDLIRHHLHSP
ncbi:MAG: DegT/DnrJ/EryC1/StrS family aminotransferase [Cyanobacteriota bacterium]|jgi:dTDP-4-amino-4,6-dideoxygalactose transaminase